MELPTGEVLHIIHDPASTSMAAAIAEQYRNRGIPADRRTSIQAENADEATLRELNETAQRHLRALKATPVPCDRRVFISYARADEEEARRFHLALLRQGLFTSFDQSETSCGVPIGANWLEWIFERLSSCIALAFFYSRASKVSVYVNHEVGFFLERMKLQGVPMIMVLPHQIQDVEVFRRTGVSIVDFYRLTTEQSANDFIEKLVKFFEDKDDE